MATHVAPGLYTRVLDFSEYATQLSSTILCAVGAARKGSMTDVIEITSEEDCIRKLGNPLTDDYGVQSVLQFLRQGNRVLYRRVGRDDTNVTEQYLPKTASAPIPGTDYGTAATTASGVVTFTGGANPGNGETITIRTMIPKISLQNDNNGAIGNVTITTNQAANILVTGMAGGTATTPATGTVAFKASYVPVSGDNVVISDGVTSVIFQFGTGGDITVAIAANDPYTTMGNLLTAINAHAFDVTGYNLYSDHTYIFEFDNDGVVVPGNFGVTIGSTAGATLLNLMTAINYHLSEIATAVDASDTAPKTTVTTVGKGAERNGKIMETGAAITATGLTGGADAVAGSSTTVMSVAAASPGTWGNNLRVEFRATSVYGAPDDNFDVLIYDVIDDAGTVGAVERFNNISTADKVNEDGDYDPDGTANPRFIETVFAEGILGETAASLYLRADVLDIAGHPTLSDPEGTVVITQLGTGVGGSVVGSDGVADLTADDYIGTSVNRRGLSALTNPETTEFNLLIIPGVADKDVIAKAFLVLEMRGGDAMYFVDTPFGLTMQQAIDWHNGLLAYPGAPTSPLDNYLGSAYWAWGKVYDAYNKQNIWLPPSGFIAGQAAYTDNTAAPWFTLAGKVRGRIPQITALEYSPDIYERETIAGGTNRLNPIVNFKDTGPTIYGNRTLQRRATSLDSVHIVRGLINAKKLIATSVQYLVFDPSDPVTWTKFCDLVNPRLAAMKAGRGLEQYRVVCDETTNPPDQRQRKIMKGKIQMVPVDAAEIIEVDFAISAAGTTFSI